MKKTRSFVLDTSAVFCLKDNENGASKVEDIIKSCAKGQCEIYISFMTLMEYYYISTIRLGEDSARQAYHQLTLLPFIVIESDEELGLAAAELKANHNISVADSWIAAIALKTNSVLVHRDPEFGSISKHVKCLALPYK
ncbi:MAG: type II toxin-antitoxin system VapC family toxin [Candidatus Saganbacteria bacterium]|nr:type II toxin-antitoxin system VapC family toxin [Candidatus Saganbacteria bacterium]